MRRKLPAAGETAGETAGPSEVGPKTKQKCKKLKKSTYGCEKYCTKNAVNTEKSEKNFRGHCTRGEILDREGVSRWNTRKKELSRREVGVATRPNDKKVSR
jgi:hypothetical protein